MKKIFLILGLAVALGACSSASEKSATEEAAEAPAAEAEVAADTTAVAEPDSLISEQADSTGMTE